MKKIIKCLLALLGIGAVICAIGYISDRADEAIVDAGGDPRTNPDCTGCDYSEDKYCEAMYSSKCQEKRNKDKYPIWYHKL